MGTIWDYIPVIIATFVGFCLLAAILLVPIYLFLKREEKVADHWTPNAVDRRRRKTHTQPPNSAAPKATGPTDTPSV